MKKLKLVNPILIATAVIPNLGCITSCSNAYDEIASLIQENVINIFNDFSSGEMGTSHAPKHRRTFACQDIFWYIHDKMAENGYSKPSGRDYWTNIPEVKAEQEKILSSDEYGNIWYDIEPTPGCENWEPIMLQSHYDMTLQFNSSAPEVEKYWEDYGVESKIDYENEIMWTESLHPGGPGKNYMSLGADGGIGVAFMLTLAQSNINSMFKHGPIRLMFTADEGGPTEHFQTGAHLLAEDEKNEADEGWVFWERTPIMWLSESERPFQHELESTKQKIKYQNIISVAALNSKYIYQSAAGIHECVLSANLSDPGIVHKVKRGAGTDEKFFYTMNVSGLYGGHSAEDINDGIGNALQLLFDVFDGVNDGTIEIISVSSGNNPYRIPDEAEIVFASKKELTFWENVCAARQTRFRSKWKVDGDRINVSVIDCPLNMEESLAINEKHSEDLIFLITSLVYGPQYWYDLEHREVKTSVNFCPLTIKTISDSSLSFEFHITCRSGDATHLDRFSGLAHWLIETHTEWLYNYLVHIKTDVWEKEDNNPLVNLMFEGYKASGVNVELKNCHGWFEIACLGEAFTEEDEPHFACIGPTIYDAHTNFETLYFDTIVSFIKGVLYTFSHANNL